MDFRQIFFIIAKVFIEIERLRNIGVRFIRLDDNEFIYHVIKTSEPEFQNFQLVKKCEAVVNFHDSLPIRKKFVVNAVDRLCYLRAFN